MPYARYRRTYGRRRTRRRNYRRAPLAPKLTTAGPVSNLRYFDLYSDFFPKAFEASDQFQWTVDDYYKWAVYRTPAGAPAARSTDIWQSMLPMEIGTGYGTIREQNYKLHSFHCRFRISEFGQEGSIPDVDGTVVGSNLRPSDAVRIVLFFDTAGFGTVMPSADPTALFGSFASNNMKRDLEFKDLFRDADRFKIVADKRISLSNGLTSFRKEPGAGIVNDTAYFVSFGYHRYVDFHWKAPRPVLVRVNDTLNASTSVGNLQLYCACIHVQPKAAGNSLTFLPHVAGAARVVFSNV